MMTLRDHWSFARLLAIDAVSGELEFVSAPYRRLADHLAALPLDERHVAFGVYLLSKSEEAAGAIVKAIADVRPNTPPPEVVEALPFATLADIARTMSDQPWLWTGWLARNVLNPDADRRHERRALTPDELLRLFQAAERGPVVLKVSGSDRAALYRLAAGTGFRANELRSLTFESFDLSADPPTVTVEAAYFKRRRDDAQPIRSDLAEALGAWLASKAPGSPVFGNLTKHTAVLIRRDLEAVGLPYRDSSDRVADFPPCGTPTSPRWP